MEKNTEKTLSKDIHDSTEYYSKFKNEWIEHNEKHGVESFDNEELKVGRLLKKYPLIRDVAIDIGSGGGWMTNELSKHFKKVIAIEPSSKAITICKELYPQDNITWINGYSEDVLNDYQFDYAEKYFINTCSVFIHLNDDHVIPTLKALNKNFSNSILSFQELWSIEKHFNIRLLNCRTKKWWEEQLSNWDLNFHGPDMSKFGFNYIDVNKGIHGIVK